MLTSSTTASNRQPDRRWSALRAVARAFDVVALDAEGAAQRAGQGRVVVDDQQPVGGAMHAPGGIIPGAGFLREFSRPRSMLQARGRMNLTRLQTFVEVARRGTFAAAADALSFTPSAVSQQMTKLEGEMGAALLVREATGVRLTEAGRVLHEHAVGDRRGGPRRAGGARRAPGRAGQAPAPRGVPDRGLHGAAARAAPAAAAAPTAELLLEEAPPAPSARRCSRAGSRSACGWRPRAATRTRGSPRPCCGASRCASRWPPTIRSRGSSGSTTRRWPPPRGSATARAGASRARARSRPRGGRRGLRAGARPGVPSRCRPGSPCAPLAGAPEWELRGRARRERGAVGRDARGD